MSTPVADPGDTVSPPEFPRVTRLDAAAAVRQLLEVTGVRLEVEGP